MAKEQATITFSLEDDFSTKMAEIVTKLEDFKRRLDETSKSGTEGFRKVAESVKGVGDHSAGANASLRSMSTYMREAFEGFNRSLAGSVSGLSKWEGMLTTLGPKVREFGGHFGKLGATLGIIGGAAATAAGGIYLLGRRLAESYEQSRLLEIKLGATRQEIENINRLWARMGKGPEDAARAMEKIRQAAEDTRKGTAADWYKKFYEGLEGVGPEVAERVQKELIKVREGQISPVEFEKWFLKNVYGVQTKDEAKRKIADIVGTPFEELELAFKNIDKVIPATALSKPMEEALDKLSDVLSTFREKLGNQWIEIQNQFGQEWIENITTAINEMSGAFEELAPSIGKAIGEITKGLGTTINELLRLVRAARAAKRALGIGGKEQDEAEGEQKGWWQSIFPGAKSGMEAIFPNIGPDVPNVSKEAQPGQRTWRIDPLTGKRIEGGGTPQRFGAYGGADLSGLGINENFKKMISDPELIRLGQSRIEDRRQDNQGVGGQPIVLTQMAESQREMADDMSEVRDVLTWLRDQILSDYPIAVHDVGEEAWKKSRGANQQGGGGGGGGGGAGGGDGGGGGGAPGLNVPTSPGQAPETLEAAQKGGFMRGGGAGAVGDKILDAIQKQEGWFPGSLSFRQNNPGNLKFGPFAKAHGATGAGAGGHAIFPDYATGRAALRALVETKGAGKSLAQISQWYAEGPQGGMHWAQGVAKYAGVDPSYVPTQAGGGSATATGFQTGDIHSAVYGPQSGQGDAGRTPPSNLLEAAKRVAAMGGGPAVYQFMASQGYPKAGNWCGEFAAAVVRSAGGTPPRNPEVASNWRNFGQQVASPQPGDIAVRRGVRTGSTGSHVTIVGQVGQGTFQGIGGNQRAGFISRFSTGTYDFFRPGGKLAGGQPLDAAAMAGVAGMAGGMGAGGGGMAMPGAGGGGGLLGALGGGGGFGGGGGGVSGQATITINVTVPPGAQVQSSAQGSGILANPTVTTSRAGQMSAAGQNASPRPNYYGNEY